MKFPGDWLVTSGVCFALALMTLGWPPLRRRGVFIAMIAGGIGALAVAFLLLGRDYSVVADEAKSWPSAEATVWKSERVQSPGGNAAVHFEIGYLYQVGGKSYSGDTLTFGTYEETEATAQSLMEAFPVGRRITIYFDPSDPQRSVVWLGRQNVALMTRVVGAALVVMSVACVFWFLRRWRQQQSP